MPATRATTEPPPHARKRTGRLVELIALFVVAPIVYGGFIRAPALLFPLLWVWALLCMIVLLRDKSFDRRVLWRTRGLRAALPVILIRFAILAAAITALIWLMQPDMFFSLVRANPGLWAIIMVAYPIFSVYPQEIIFRVYFFHRYRSLFGARGWLIATSAIAFALAHVVFPTPQIAVGMTFVGGVIFAWTYGHTRSAPAAAIEHALYGCFVFTIGIGRYFYAGPVN